MILRCVVVILRCFLVAIAALFLLGVAVLISALTYTPTYDRSDPDYAHYMAVFHQVHLARSQGAKAKDDDLDLSRLNAGEWTIACAFGGYTDPVRQMDALGATISKKDRERMNEARHGGFRLGPVEEYEFALAFVDLQNNARFIHFEHGIGPDGQHLRRCIAKPETRLSLASNKPAVLLFPEPSTDKPSAP